MSEAGRAHRHLLAHSLAESRSVRNLPVGARTFGRPAGRGPDRLPYSGALQQFSGDGGRGAGVADRMGTFRRQARWSDHACSAISYQRGLPRSGTLHRAIYFAVCRARRAVEKLGVEASFLGVGVDRVDYTKGILECFRGIERFLEKCPNYVGKFTFVEIGAPSRTHIPRYHDFLNEVEQEAARINFRFQTDKWKPIVLLTRHHGHSEIQPYYRAADLCMITSLHDGMNLAAKEFIAAREDDEGPLILSQFTGASRELRDALVVNPYDIEQLSDAIRLALEMSPDDRCARMQRMRRTVREHNVHRWAGNLIAELSEIRIGENEPTTNELSRVV